jgi:uncharacterized phiE125 gp8 family phage protein
MTIVVDDNRGIVPKPLPSHGNRAWKVTTEPLTEPITKDEVKFYARLDGTYEDDFIDNIIKSVRISAERYMGRALITQSITMSMDWWPGEQVELPRPPLIDITSIKTIDEDGTETTYSSDNYFIDTNSEPGKVVIKNGVTFPENNDRYQGGYQIIFRAGYGGDSSDVPEAIRTGLIAWVTWIYENRKPISKPPEQAHAALFPYKVVRI